ncbi:MAG TPA: potassium channel protein [Candidatus Methylomirabilis sp.]|nr:potassium channel protein [Candidatus Methylomirabilis sp.]HSC71158.1 potassium channel protein [Candidatus Methylomirabilis sp.]
MRLQKRMLLIGLLFAVVFTGGTTAFMLVEGWPLLDALYMTAITLSTVGFQEVHPLGTGGRLVAIALILGGTGSLAYGLSMVTAFIVEGELTDVLGKRRMHKALAQLHRHVIVCGAGETGKHVVEELRATHTPCVVIEQAPSKCRRLDRLWTIPIIEGDATDGDILLRARIREARGLVTTLPSDKDNLFVILTARELNPSLRIVTLAIEAESQTKLCKAGADAVVSANRIGGLRMASEMIRPHVVSFLDSMLRDPTGTLRVEEAAVPADSPVVGKTLADLDLLNRVGLVVIATRRRPSGEYLYNPKSSTQLQAGDVLIVCGEPAQVEALRDLLAKG